MERLLGMGIGKRIIRLFMSAALLGATLGAVTAVPGADPAGAQVPYTFEEVAEIDGLTDVHARTFRLYWAFFDRQPDPAGALYWANQVNQCWSLERIANFFATSDEFVATYGTLTDGQFVDLIYRNVLDRTAEPSGRAFWVSEIASGARSRVQVMLDFAYSDEFVRAHPLPSSGIPDQPCSTTAPAIPAPGTDGAVLKSDILNAVIPTSVCGTIVTDFNNQLIDGKSAPSIFVESIGGYAQARTDESEHGTAGFTYGYFDDNNIRDAAMMLDCFDGTGNFVGNHVIVQLDSGPAFTFTPQDASVLRPTGGEPGLIEGLNEGDGLLVEWRAYGPVGPLCCPTIWVFSEFTFRTDGPLTRGSVHVEGPDAVAREVAAAAVANDWGAVFERIDEDLFIELYEFQAQRDRLDFDDSRHCFIESGTFVCPVLVENFDTIYFEINYDQEFEIYAVTSIRFFGV